MICETMKIVLCLLAIFVIGNCQNEFIDEAQDVDENSDLQERSEDEAQYFDSEDLSDIEERSDDTDEAEDIDDAEDMEDREKRSETDEEEETADMEEESTIAERSAGKNITYIERFAVLKSLWGVYRKEQKNYIDEVKACAQKKNFEPFGNCIKCRRRCGVGFFMHLGKCGCESICKADREEFKKACTIDRSGMKFTKKMFMAVSKGPRKLHLGNKSFV